jgi:phytanoyl-CoA hydroxylase
MQTNQFEKTTTSPPPQRPAISHQPFSSWTDGKPPTGYFKQNDPNIASFFAEHGYMVLEHGLSAEEIQTLNQTALEICRGQHGAIQGLEPALPEEPDTEVLRRYLCIHFPHKISRVAFDVLSHKNIVDVLTKCVSPNVKAMQSMLFIKASGKPGQAWHQDEYFIPTRDRSLIGAWIALDDATTENGCLWVIPGSHKRGVLYPQHQQRDSRFDCTGEAVYFPYTDDDAVPVEVKAGSVVFFNGYLLHRSLPNYAPSGYRRVLVNHYMSAESLLPWMGDGGATGDYRDIVMVAGDDPYAFKGLEERAAAHVRPSGEGGCGNIERNTEALQKRNMVLLEDDHD